MGNSGAEAILRHLETKAAREGNLSRLLEFYRQMLGIQVSVENRLTSFSPTIGDNGTVAARLSQGTPLLDVNDLTTHIDLLEQSFREVAASFAQYPDLFGNIPCLDTALTPGEARAWLESSEMPAMVTGSGIKVEVLQAMLQSAFKPLLSSAARSLLPRVKQETWRRSYCPVCGGCADLAYLDKAGGARWLMCARCDAAWLFQRLECPGCGTQEQDALSYLTDETGRYRLYLCEKCKHYLKAVDLRQGEDEVLLPLERFYTLDLDRQARSLGYKAIGQP